MPVMTINGSVPADQLGITAPHEHIAIDTTNFYKEPDPATDRAFANARLSDLRQLGRLRLDPSCMKDNFILNDPGLQIREVDEFRKAGGRTIVDLTLPGIGRDVEYLKEVAAATGLQIVAGTGYYVQSSHPAYVADATSAYLADLILSEIRDGIGRTGVRPGVIGEIGVGYIFHPDEKKVLVASAIAQKDSGLPLSIHVSPWCANGIEAMEILKQEGIAPDRICICHSDGEGRRDYIHRLLDMGVFIEFDDFGKEFSVLNHKNIRKGNFGKFISDWQREELLAELITEGYEDQLLVSCDVCLKMFLLEYGGFGYAHFLKNIVPELLMYGVSQKTIDKLLITNPARFLDS